MSSYERLLDEAESLGLTVIERYPFESPRIRGLCCDDTIALSAQIDTEAERSVILGEELIHATCQEGELLDDPRMERRARERNFDRFVGLSGLVNAFVAGCREPWEFAEFLGVPEEFFVAAMKSYTQRYGTMVTANTEHGVFTLTFEPTFRLKRLVRTPRKKRWEQKKLKEEVL